MYARVLSVFSFSTLAMVAVAAMLVFGSANKVQANETAKQVIEAGLHGADTVYATITKQQLSYTMVGFIIRGFDHMQKFLPKKLYCTPKNLKTIHSAQLITLMYQESQNRPGVAELVGPENLLLYALMKAFPCK